MRESPHRQPEHARSEMWLTTLVRYVWFHGGIGISIGVSLVLLAWDAVFSGSCLMSLILCPIWILASVVKNAIQRSGWRLGILRIVIPTLTFGVAIANNAVQVRIAESNAPRIVAACEEFYAATGRFPKTLDELVPRYMPSVPRAKYCLNYGEFVYFSHGKPMLAWYVVPPFDRRIYDFETRRWSHIE